MVKTIEQEKIKFKELALAVKFLNTCDLLKNKINTVGKSKEEIVALFIDGVQSIPDDAEGNWNGPEEAALYYQSIVVPDEVPVKEEKKTAAPKAEKKKAAPKAEKGAKKNRIEATGECLFACLGSGSVSVDDAVVAANTFYSKEGGKGNEKEAKWALNVALSALKGFGVISVADGMITKK